MYRRHRAGPACRDAVFHLHRFEDEQAVARFDRLADRDIDGQHPPRHRRDDPAIAATGNRAAHRGTPCQVPGLAAAAHFDSVVGDDDMAGDQRSSGIEMHGGSIALRPDFGETVDAGEVETPAGAAHRQAMRRVTGP